MSIFPTERKPFPFYLLLDKDHYKLKGFPDMFPDLSEKIMFSKKKSDETPAYLFFKDKMDHMIVHIIHSNRFGDMVCEIQKAPTFTNTLTVTEEKTKSLSNYFQNAYVSVYLKETRDKISKTPNCQYASFSRYDSVSDFFNTFTEFLQDDSTKFIGRVDLKNFYGQFYCHALSWSLLRDCTNNKNFRELWPYDIEMAVRSCIEATTVGLPIGQEIFPDIAELFLISLDIQIVEELKVNIIRHDDSYYIFTKNKDECYSIVARLGKLVAKYKHYLCGYKADIVSKPNAAFFSDLISNPPTYPESDYIKGILHKSNDSELNPRFLMENPVLFDWLFENCEEISIIDISFIADTDMASHVAIFKHLLRIKSLHTKTFVDHWFKNYKFMYSTLPSVQLVWCLWVCYKMEIKISDNVMQIARELDDDLIEVLLDLLDGQTTSEHGYFKLI